MKYVTYFTGMLSVCRMLSDEIKHNNIKPNLYVSDRCSNSIFFKRAYPNEITKKYLNFKMK